MSYKRTKMYECLNPHCRKFVGSASALGSKDTFEFDGEMRCLECGRTVRSRAILPVELLMGIPLVFGIVLVVVLAFSQ